MFVEEFDAGLKGTDADRARLARIEALRARGVEVDYMVKDNEGHGFHNEENRFDFYRAMEKFFGKHLKGVRPEGDIVPESCRR